MTAVLPHLPALQVVIPLIGALLAGLLRRPAAAFGLALLVSWLMPLIAGTMLWQVSAHGPISYHLGGWAPPWGIEYRVDLLNGFVLLLVAAIGAVIMPFAPRSVSFEIDESRRAWFYCMYLLCLTGLLGITITGDAFNAFVFLEISSLSTYVLIALGRDRRALLASFRYLVMGTIGATFYVIGVGFLYLVTGSLNMVDIAARLGPLASEHSRSVVAGIAFLTVGISLKLALFPLHAWLPNAYAYGPSWTTAFLAGTATKVAVYLLIRLLFGVFGITFVVGQLPISAILITLSVAAMFVASIIAVFERDLKRMLAYSSVAQIGYITLGIGLANESGLTGSLTHLVNHAVMKSALFLALGAVFLRVGTLRLDDLAGLGRKMPITMTVFAIAGFGLVGTPGTAGFISKWYLGLGALDRGWWPVLMLVMASSLIAVLYIGRVVEVVWFRPTSPAVEHATDPPLSMLIPLLLLAAATVYFGFDTQLTAGLGRR
jgi:multicomponent Na+:H+ antiporter subunit D